MSDSNNNAPEPGSYEYDLEMARRYRGQHTETPLTEDGRPGSQHREVVAPGGASIGIRKDSTVGPPDRPVSFTAEQADPGQITSLEAEIERIKSDLSQTTGYDRMTGEPLLYYTGEQRRLREMRLAHLEHAELPAVRALVAAAQQWRAENVETPEAALRRQKAERDAIYARAEEIAQERAAEVEASRLLKSRGLGIGIK